jgi:anti-sigma factor RsiW
LTCRRSDEVDLPGYLVDPGDPASAGFRAHYPTCPDCSRAVERWTRLEGVVRSAARGAEPEHPAEELLLAFQTSPERLRAEDRDEVRIHLEGCPACRNDLAALASFDFSALEREYADDEARGSVLTRRGVREGHVPRLRSWLDSLTAAVPLPALAVALLLVIAIPTALALWWTASERGLPSPPGAEVARSGL